MRIFVRLHTDEKYAKANHFGEEFSMELYSIKAYF